MILSKKENVMSDLRISYDNEKILKYYRLETECCGLIEYIIRKSDESNIATYDRFSTEIMGYSSYEDDSIDVTITCTFTEKERPVLEYFFGKYFNK